MSVACHRHRVAHCSHWNLCLRVAHLYRKCCELHCPLLVWTPSREFHSIHIRDSELPFASRVHLKGALKRYFESGHFVLKILLQSGIIVHQCNSHKALALMISFVLISMFNIQIKMPFLKSTYFRLAMIMNAVPYMSKLGRSSSYSESSCPFNTCHDSSWKSST